MLYTCFFECLMNDKTKTLKRPTDHPKSPTVLANGTDSAEKAATAATGLDPIHGLEGVQEPQQIRVMRRSFSSKLESEVVLWRSTWIEKCMNLL